MMDNGLVLWLEAVLFQLAMWFDKLLLATVFCLLLQLLLGVANRIIRKNWWYTSPAGILFVLGGTLLSYQSSIAERAASLVKYWLFYYPAASSLASWLVPAAAVLWLCGIIWLGVRYIRGMVRLSKQIKYHGLPHKDAAFYSAAQQVKLHRAVGCVELAGICTPGLWGVWRPVIVVPPGFAYAHTPQQRRMIYLHELCHVNNHDTLIILLLQIAGILLWPFRPLTAELRKAALCREIAADKQVLAVFPAPSEYGWLLLQQLKTHSGVPVSFFARGYRNARCRLTEVAGGAIPVRQKAISIIVAVGLLAVLFCGRAPQTGGQYQLHLQCTNNAMQVYEVGSLPPTKTYVNQLLHWQNRQAKPVKKAYIVHVTPKGFGLLADYMVAQAEQIET